MVEEGGAKRPWKIIGHLDTVVQFCLEEVKNLG